MLCFDTKTKHLTGGQFAVKIFYYMFAEWNKNKIELTFASV